MRKGWIFLKLYEHPLSITFFLLFLLSVALHAIWLREKKSPESKEVNAPHDKTGK